MFDGDDDYMPSFIGKWNKFKSIAYLWSGIYFYPSEIDFYTFETV